MRHVTYLRDPIVILYVLWSAVSCPLMGFLNGVTLHISGVYAESAHIHSPGPKIFLWSLKVRVLQKAHASYTLPVWPNE